MEWNLRYKRPFELVQKFNGKNLQRSTLTSFTPFDNFTLLLAHLQSYSNMSRYTAAHAKPQGPGNVRPTALQIVNDEGLGPVRFDHYNFDMPSSYDPWQALAQSKTSNIYLAARSRDATARKACTASRSIRGRPKQPARSRPGLHVTHLGFPGDKGKGEVGGTRRSDDNVCGPELGLGR